MSTVNNHNEPEVGEPSNTVNAVLLLKILYGLKPTPLSNLVEILNDNADNVLGTTKDTIEEMSSFIRENYGSDMTYGQMRRTSKYNFERKLTLTQILYYKILESIVSFESISGERFGSMEYLSSKMFQKSLFACCLDIIFLICRYNLKFPWVLSFFSIYSYEFYGVIELVVRAESDLPSDIVKYLNWVEQEILEHLMWKSDSPVWKEIIVSEFSIPTYQVALTAQQTLCENELKVCNVNNDIRDIIENMETSSEEEAESEGYESGDTESDGKGPVLSIEVYEMNLVDSNSDNTNDDHVQSEVFDICYNDKGIPCISLRSNGNIESGDSHDDSDSSDESDSQNDSNNSEEDTNTDSSDGSEDSEEDTDTNSSDGSEDSEKATDTDSSDGSEDSDDSEEDTDTDCSEESEDSNDDDKREEKFGMLSKSDVVRYKYITRNIIAFKTLLMINDLPEQKEKKRIMLIVLFRKFYHLASMRIRNFCDKLHLMDTDLRQRIGACFEYMVLNHFSLIRDSHMDIIIICSMYTIIKVLDIPILLEDVINCHLNEPTLPWGNGTPNGASEIEDIFTKDKLTEFYQDTFLKLLGPDNALRLGKSSVDEI